jgi:hypothetical protein
MSMRRLLAVVALVLVGTAARSETIGGPNAFSFVALGDMPYNIPGDYAKFDRLIGVVNALKPAFTIHVGDIKSGSTPCSDDIFRKVLGEFETFDGPLVYTIGDNEWTDCHRKDAGGFDPRERLARVREIFFANPQLSLGRSPMPVESQGKVMPQFSTFVENTRFEKDRVLFVGLHIPGSNNGFEAPDPAAAQEFFARDAANVAWIDTAFAKAKEANHKALVLFLQADFDESRLADGTVPRQSGFLRTIDAIERGAAAFGRPVLLIHGDEHHLSVGPLRNNKGKPIPGVTNLMVMGEIQVHAVRVVVDPDSPSVFAFQPILVPENGNF